MFGPGLWADGLRGLFALGDLLEGAFESTPVVEVEFGECEPAGRLLLRFFRFANGAETASPPAPGAGVME